MASKIYSIQSYYQFYKAILPTPNENLINLRHNDDSSSVIEDTDIDQSLRTTKTNDLSGLLFNNNTSRMNEIYWLPQFQKLDFVNKNQVQSSEYQTVSETINTKNSDAVVELNDYIFYKEVKYTIDEFLENMQKEIKFLKKNNRELDDYLSHEHETIDEGIRAIRRGIEDIKYGRDYNINGSVRWVHADASHQNLCQNSFSFQIRAEYNNLVK
ncbi:8168_t:CDS:2, partial [Racocetra fulgida]